MKSAGLKSLCKGKAGKDGSYRTRFPCSTYLVPKISTITDRIDVGHDFKRSRKNIVL